MAAEKGPEETLTDAEISEVKQPRRKFLIGMAAAGLVEEFVALRPFGKLERFIEDRAERIFFFFHKFVRPVA